MLPPGSCHMNPTICLLASARAPAAAAAADGVLTPRSSTAKDRVAVCVRKRPAKEGPSLPPPPPPRREAPAARAEPSPPHLRAAQPLVGRAGEADCVAVSDGSVVHVAETKQKVPASGGLGGGRASAGASA